jgi:hypothetical protein
MELEHIHLPLRPEHVGCVRRLHHQPRVFLYLKADNVWRRILFDDSRSHSSSSALGDMAVIRPRLPRDSLSILRAVFIRECVHAPVFASQGEMKFRCRLTCIAIL